MMTSLDMSVDDMIYVLRPNGPGDDIGGVLVENYEAEAIIRQLESAKDLYRLVRTMQNLQPHPHVRAALHSYEMAGRFRHEPGKS